ncbi:hypothetical protein [Paenibacillus glufosinatiresistens]|uniref:hypothetical protein n=1 Tax=Paenibacillus glufosinatiresistens TaxID=3070657 RepID=UPI00286DF54F|nr:hypothetical protein [Paenibacillus sp. YX.27]
MPIHPHPPKDGLCGFSLRLAFAGLALLAGLAAACGPVSAVGAPPAAAAVHPAPVSLPAPTADAAPSVRLLAFVQAAVDKLSQQEPYGSWIGAKPSVYPLGPGTHGWLVQLTADGRRVGYLIVTAAEDGGYALSEYGAGSSGLPYDLEALRAFSARNGLLLSSLSSGSWRLTPCYNGILPYWRLDNGSGELLVSAVQPELLPVSAAAPSPGSGEAANAPVLTGILTSGNADRYSPQTVIRASAPAEDPYDNLLWLSAPRLRPASAAELGALLRTSPALVFRASGTNGAGSGPLAVTGCQAWTPAGQPTDGAEVLYAAAGPGGQRMLPLASLLRAGTLQAYAAQP